MGDHLIPMAFSSLTVSDCVISTEDGRDGLCLLLGY